MLCPSPPCAGDAAEALLAGVSFDVPFPSPSAVTSAFACALRSPFATPSAFVAPVCTTLWPSSPPSSFNPVEILDFGSPFVFLLIGFDCSATLPRAMVCFQNVEKKFAFMREISTDISGSAGVNKQLNNNDVPPPLPSGSRASPVRTLVQRWRAPLRLNAGRK